MSRTWCRLYTGTRNHRKIKLLRAEHPDYWTYWYVLIELAGEVNDKGWIYVAPGIPFTDKQLANELGMKRVSSWNRLRTTLERLKLVTVTSNGILVNSFAERNFESDISTPRVQKHREKIKEQGDDETFHQNVAETDQNRTETEQNRTEQIIRQKTDGVTEDFKKFWEHYPRRIAKQEAIRKWKGLKKAGRLPPLEEIIRAIEEQKTWDKWKEDGGKYIPHPATWLNQGRWEDQPPEDMTAFERKQQEEEDRKTRELRERKPPSEEERHKVEEMLKARKRVRQ